MFLERELPEYTAEERALRAQAAKGLLRDPFFQSVMEQTENAAIAEWLRNVSPEARERCWLLCAGLETVMGTLRAIIAEGPPE